MNENTLITVHCYAGDADVVQNALPFHERHMRPILVLSPENSRVKLPDQAGGTEFKYGGKRGYFGQDSLDRQVIHMRMMLETPHKYFLMNDSDSICLSREIPRYLYEQSEDTVWSNIVNESRPHTSPYPKIAFHPPYFMTRATLEKLLAVADHDEVKAHPITPFIDWFMMALTNEAQLSYASFPDGKSFPAWRHESIPDTVALGHDYRHENICEGGKDGAARMYKHASNGFVMIHSVKHKEVLTNLIALHDDFKEREKLGTA